MIRRPRAWARDWDAYDWTMAGLVGLLVFFILLVLAGAVQTGIDGERCVLSHDETRYLPVGSALVPLRYHVCDQWGEPRR